jgi:hypothetical protein
MNQRMNQINNKIHKKINFVNSNLILLVPLYQAQTN